jgi:hypothetical protein
MISQKKLTKFFALIIFTFFANTITANAQIENSETNSSIYELPPGTEITVRMASEINSKSFGIDDTFQVRVSEPLEIRNIVVLPTDAIIEGKITKVERASLGGKNGDLDVVFETLRLDNGTKLDIEANLSKKLETKSSHKFNLLTILGSTVLGGLIGAVSGNDNGALIGASLGAGVGTGTAVIRKGKEVRIRRDETFKIKLTKKVTLPAEDF